MKIICPECEFVIDRDKIIEGQIAEEYKNIYGTNCPKCGAIIKPKIIEKRDLRIDILRKKMIEKIKDNLRRK